MALRIEGLNEAKIALANLAGQMPYALSRANNDMAKEARLAGQDQMRSDLENPTPWSVGALQYETGTKENPRARTWFIDKFRPENPGIDDAGYLGVHIFGGVRQRRRRSEIFFQQIGIMPHGYTWVPDPSYKLNRYGNVEGAVIRNIMDAIRNNSPGIRVTEKGIFGIIEGTYEYSEWSPILWFERAFDYKKRYMFYERVNKEVNAKFVPLLNKFIDDALATAR